MSPHPSATHWVLPPTRDPIPAPLERTNLRRLMARDGRHEHHLSVVARVGIAQLEVVTASEPLFFAHQNISDEYVIGLETGDALVDGMPLRTFLSDAESGEDAARIRHRAHDLILHPHGWSHWPGRLRAPYEPPAFPPGVGRRAGLSLVFCASRPSPPVPDRGVWVSEGRAADAKPYRDEAPPLLLAELEREDERVLAQVGDVTLRWQAPPFAPARGGWVVLLEGDTADAFAGDLVRIPAGETYAPEGVTRALLVESASAEPEHVRQIWSRVPEGPLSSLPAPAWPAAIGAMTLHEHSATQVEVKLGESTSRVPRYWLARMLYRIALHTTVMDVRRGPPQAAFGHVETYGGFFYDDRASAEGAGVHRFGLRGGDLLTEVPAEALIETLSAAYVTVRPDAHGEDLR